MLTLTLCLFFTSAFSQNTETKKALSQSPITINVPDFSDPGVKKFYTAYSSHLIKCIEAIRQKNEAKVTALFKNPGEQLVSDEKILAPKVVKNPVEKQKYMQFAAQAYPYIKEVEQSIYYQKMYGKSEKNN